jgi:hypothetical protein
MKELNPMTQADCVLSTPRPNTPVDPTRRRFLSTAASVAVGGTALALASPPARAADDPVFALIEAHKAAAAVFAAAATEKSRLEDTGDWDADGGTDATGDAELDALDDLIEAVPTTIAGVIASLVYVSGLVDGYGRIGDDLIALLLANLAGALEGLAVAS